MYTARCCWACDDYVCPVCKKQHTRPWIPQSGEKKTSHDRHLGEQAYSFDALNQLQSHRVGLDIHRYQFDSFGNQVSESSVVEQD
ncbi:hypothetical protein, partial [Photobacterium sanguinicancri]|uniref:hypothetical protein n=1 Tax=Photobacterium sanguinicancri TaxID=875932 RepID=UPI0026E157CB